jgi:regulatory protein
LPWSKRIPAQERSADAAAAREKALDLLTGRDFGSQELYERLCRRFTEQAAASAVAEMVELRYVDDTRYAAQKARSLMAQHKSRRAIADAMRRKGLERGLIDTTLEMLYAPTEETPDAPDADVTAAAALIEKKYTRKLAEGRRDLVMAALARRGFSYSTAKAALALLGETPQPGTLEIYDQP